jgi:hypothetical protein
MELPSKVDGKHFVNNGRNEHAADRRGFDRERSSEKTYTQVQTFCQQSHVAKNLKPLKSHRRRQILALVLVRLKGRYWKIKMALYSNGKEAVDIAR